MLILLLLLKDLNTSPTTTGTCTLHESTPLHFKGYYCTSISDTLNTVSRENFCTFAFECSTFACYCSHIVLMRLLLKDLNVSSTTADQGSSVFSINNKDHNAEEQSKVMIY